MLKYGQVLLIPSCPAQRSIDLCQFAHGPSIADVVLAGKRVVAPRADHRPLLVKDSVARRLKRYAFVLGHWC